ncbi:MAG: response regulator receiver [Puniceicoccaceae bacterium 5H]|nr:MAG: response regulator receiver [Puniceicoccaceae bacterium 5H]
MATVLIVEDDLLARTLLKRMLEGAGHNACFADTVLGGWQLMQSTISVDLIILDNVLGEEYGWQFLRDLRADPIFKHIPVLVYTATSDRGSVIKYLKLGVQNILVKPYAKGRVMQELEKALSFSWRDKLFEPAEHVCHRLDLSDDEYYRMLHMNAESILDVVHNLKGAIGTARMRKSAAYLDKLHSISKALGVTALDDIADGLHQHLQSEDLNQSIADLRQAEFIAKLMQHRFAVHFEIQSESDLSENIREKEPLGSARRQQRKQEWAQQARHAAREAWQQMTKAPFYQYSKLFSQLNLPAQRWDESVPGLKLVDYLPASLSHWVDELFTPGRALGALATVPGLNVHLSRLVSEEGERITGTAALKKGLEKFGAGPLIVALLLNLWQDEARRLGNPIDLRPLARYTLGSSILYWDLTRKLPVAREAALAGMMPLLGQWLWATAQPLRYSLLVAWAQASMSSFHEASYRIFGELAEDAAQRWLVEQQAPSPLVAAARDYTNPDRAEGEQARVVASMAQLAETLIAGASIGFRGYLNEDGTDAFIHATAWHVLDASQVELSLSPSELLAAMEPLIKRVPRLVDTLQDLPSMPLLEEAPVDC